MTINDVSQFNSAIPADSTGVIIRAGHGTTEDTAWRNTYYTALARNLHVGFYYVPETTDAKDQAAFFRQLVQTIPHTLGDWYDVAVGDLPFDPSTGFLDALRAEFDGGVYLNGDGLAMCVEYQRFERLWYAGQSTPARWLMWQTGKLDQGVDIDIAADLGGSVTPGWSAFNWPDL